MVHDNIQRYYDDFMPPDEKRLKENYEDLCNIVELVKQGQAADVRLLAQKHVRRFSKYMMDHKYA
jgi:hypothetical protein